MDTGLKELPLEEETQVKRKSPSTVGKPRYLAIYLDEENNGLMVYTTAVSAKEMKKKLNKIATVNLLELWKGKQKELVMKSVLSF